MTERQKSEVVYAIKLEENRLGSARKVATKCKVSPGTISQMLGGNWELISLKMWTKVANGVGCLFSGWQVDSTTTNYRMMQKVLNDAKKNQLFIPVSYRAGSGKSEGLRGFINSTNGRYNYSLRCRRWAKRELLENLLRTIGVEKPRGYLSIDSLSQIVIDFFAEIKMHRPFLALDQANSLKPSALEFLIDLYNEMEDHMALVVIGTESLEKNIKRGVRYNKSGFDEIDSRLGRNYIQLVGATKSDVVKVCAANGILSKEAQNRVFKESNPIRKKVGKNIMTLVEDMRRVKRMIQAEQIKMAQGA